MVFQIHNLVDTELKEDRRHSDEAMPIKRYSYSAPPGRTPVHCHWHDEMEFFLLKKGKARIQCGGSCITAEPESLLFFNSGQLHAAENAGTGEVVFRSIVFHPDLLGGSGVAMAKYITPVISGRLKTPTVIQDETGLGTAFDRLYNILNEKLPGYELEAQSMLLHMFYILISCAGEPDEESGNVLSIKPAMEYIAQNYASPITDADLSASCSMSTGHFCRVFKRQATKTPMEYLKSYRITKAMELLIAGNMKIIDVAMDSGFNSPSYFIEVFRAFTGLTPGQFRRENRR